MVLEDKLFVSDYDYFNRFADNFPKETTAS